MILEKIQQLEELGTKISYMITNNANSFKIKHSEDGTYYIQYDISGLPVITGKGSNLIVAFNDLIAKLSEEDTFKERYY